MFLVYLLLSGAISSVAINTSKNSIGSNQIKEDTSKLIPTILITGVRFQSLFTGFKLQVIDSPILAGFQQNSLANVLNSQSQIFIKNYGPGMLATPSFRGGNANHTAVIWNGFNLQNPMNGQVDFSTIPSFLLDNVAIQFGSPAALFGSGNIGGAVHITSAKPLQKGLHTEIMVGMGSFNTYSSGIKLLLNLGKWNIHQKLFWQDAENNFRYKHVDLLQPQNSQPNIKSAPVESAVNSNFQTVAWLQEIQFQMNPASKFGLKSWVQKYNRHITPSLNSQHNDAIQIDETKKIIFDYQYNLKQYELVARYGYFNDIINYTDKNTNPSITNSHNHTFYLDNIYRIRNLQVQGSFMSQTTKANLNTTQTNWLQERFAIFGTVKWHNFENKLQQQITVRQEWADGNAIPLMPSYGFNITLGKQLSVFGNVSRSYRLPTFNDLYWPNMGNKDLLPEQGWNEELSISHQILIKKINLKSTLTGFNKNIQNWIIWVPNGGAISTPKNIYQVWSRGIEYDWRIRFNIGKYYYTFRGLHDYTLATNEASNIINDASLKKQIIYTPKIKNLLQFTLQYKKLSIEYLFNYVGTRYVSADHSNWLNPYNYSSLNLGKSFVIKQKSFNCLLSIANIFNQTYQVIVNRPMPLINYQISFNTKL